MATAARRLIEQAKRLPARDRRRVLSAIEASLEKPSSPAVRQASRRTYEALIALAATAHSDACDVSSDKYAHLAAAYSDDA